MLPSGHPAERLRPHLLAEATEALGQSERQGPRRLPVTPSRNLEAAIAGVLPAKNA